MCGILGWCNFKEKPSIEILKNLSKNIFLRGPDAYGEYDSENMSMIHRRLSIIDLTEKSNQPLEDLVTGNVIVFNGEIYNFKEIKNEILAQKKNVNFTSLGDTEVILKAYQEFGIEKLLEKLDGMFAFAIWDNQKQKLFLVRDKFGEKPLFYASDNNNGIIFGSTYSVLASHPQIKKNSKLNLRSLNQYLTLNYLLFENTFDENIKSLKPSNYLVIKKKDNSIQVEQKQYWNLNSFVIEKNNCQLDEAKEKFLYLLKNSIKSRIVSDVDVGTYLSGGIDSSITTILMKEMYDNKHSFHHLSFNEKEFDESQHVEFLSKKLNVSPKIYVMPKPSVIADEFPKIVEAMDQPMSDTAFISNFYLSKFSSKFSKVVISGDGGDELFGGYVTYTADIIKKKISFVPKSILKKFNDIFIKNLRDNYSSKIGNSFKIKKFFQNSFLKNNQAHILWRSIFKNIEISKLLKNKDVLDDPNFFDKISNEYSKVKKANSLNQHMYIDLSTWFTNDILYKIDRSTMYHSQEARIPMLDPKIIEFSFSLPINLKINLFNKKILLKKILQDKVGKKLANRKKSGFNSPVGSWIAEDKNFKEMTIELLRGKSIKNFFNNDEIEKIFQNHIEKKEDNTYKIFNLIVLSQWLENKKIIL